MPTTHPPSGTPVAQTFKDDHALVFDLFNEPYGVDWRCWRDGCEIPAAGGRPAYRAAGMQELVETDCRHGYIDAMMRFADAHGIGYLGWAWDAVAPGGWSCTGGPSLIASYDGAPTAYGIGLRDHVQALAGARR
jgi:hypothetical protein